MVPILGATAAGRFRRRVDTGVDEPTAHLQHTGVPTVILNLRGYRLFFFSIDRGEPMHIHVARGRAYAKFWMQPLALVRSRHFRSHELNELARLLEEHREEIERKWHEHFGGED